MAILSNGTNAKTKKGDLKKIMHHSQSKTVQFLTDILYLLPEKQSGRNFCPDASEGCKKACLNTAGRGQMSNVQKGRLRKSRLFIENKQEFFSQLQKDTDKAVKRNEKIGVQTAIRLNGTSDLRWERIKAPQTGKTIIEQNQSVQFYDYTKSFRRYSQYLQGKLPKNYHLTYSFDENTTSEEIDFIVNNGGNVAVVFKSFIPETFQGHPVFSGDDHDLRFTDPKGHIIGLIAKVKAKQDQSGFVVQN